MEVGLGAQRLAGLGVRRHSLVWKEGSHVISICRGDSGALLRLCLAGRLPVPMGSGEAPVAASPCFVLSID